MSIRVILAEDGTPRGIASDATKPWADGGAIPPGWTAPTFYTRAEVLAFGERVKRKCAEILERKRDSDDRRYGGNDPAFNAMTDASKVVRAVDVARLLEDKETNNE